MIPAWLINSLSLEAFKASHAHQDGRTPDKDIILTCAEKKATAGARGVGRGRRV